MIHSKVLTVLYLSRSTWEHCSFLNYRLKNLYPNHFYFPILKPVFLLFLITFLPRYIMVTSPSLEIINFLFLPYSGLFLFLFLLEAGPGRLCNYE